MGYYIALPIPLWCPPWAMLMPPWAMLHDTAACGLLLQSNIHCSSLAHVLGPMVSLGPIGYWGQGNHRAHAHEPAMNNGYWTEEAGRMLQYHSTWPKGAPHIHPKGKRRGMGREI